MSEKTHCGLCARKLSESNQTGLGTECREKIPETLTVALLNRSEHAYHEGGSMDGSLSVSDIKNAFTQLGGTADLLIFLSGYTQGDFFFEEGQTSWEIWYRSPKGTHFIDASSQQEAFVLNGEYKATMMDDADMRKYVLLMCSKSTKTKVKLTWVDSELGFMMNRAHYNGPYPPGMDVEEWAKEIHDMGIDSIQVCWACDNASQRREEEQYHQESIDARNDGLLQFERKFPDLRYSLYREIVRNKNTDDEKVVRMIQEMFEDIRKDTLNSSNAFIGNPMRYDPTDCHEVYWNYNCIQAGEIEWLTIYGNFVFVEYLLPYLLREAYELFNEDWTPREFLPASWDKPDYAEWADRNWRRLTGTKLTKYALPVDSQRDAYNNALNALEHTLDEMYPRQSTQCTKMDCEYCDN